MERLRHLRGEAGASSVELLVFFPLLLLIILLAVQTGLSWYGNEVAMTAARETARTLRTGAHDPEEDPGEGAERVRVMNRSPREAVVWG